VTRAALLSPEVRQRLVSLVRIGMTFDGASAACGIRRATIYEWVREGQRLIKGGAKRPTPRQRELMALAEEIDRAQAEAEARDLMVIDRAAQPHDVVREVVTVDKDGKAEKRTERTREFHWQAAAWRLERRYPERYGRRDRLDVETTTTFSVKPAPPAAIEDAQGVIDVEAVEGGDDGSDRG